MPMKTDSPQPGRLGWTLLLLLSALPGVAHAGESNEYLPQREEVFEFSEAPRLACDGDQVEITFTSKGWCDVTVVVEEKAAGRILRHLASGVLGPQAPAPFQKSALHQRLIWDGKDSPQMRLCPGHAPPRWFQWPDR